MGRTPLTGMTAAPTIISNNWKANLKFESDIWKSMSIAAVFLMLFKFHHSYQPFLFYDYKLPQLNVISPNCERIMLHMFN